jgi:branched-chain amino acid transport system substrate-binding protein
VRRLTRLKGARAAAAAMATGLLLAACSGAEVVEEDDGGATETETETDGDAAEEPAGDDEAGTGEASGEPIRIGALHPTTGGLAQDGQPMSDAAQMAVDDINAAGGIQSLDGRPLELVTADTEGTAEIAQTEAQRMIDEGVVALVGPYQSAVAVNVASLAERSQIPFVVDVAVSNEVITDQSQFTFRIQPNATAMGVQGAQALADLAEATGEDVSSVVHLHDQTEFGTSINQAFAEEASSLGIEVAESIAYDPFNVSDLSTELSRVAAAGVDVLVATGYYGDGVLIARDASAVQPDIKGVFGIANGAFDINEFATDTDGAGEHFLNANYHFDATDERVQELRSRYDEEYGVTMRTAAVLTYQAVELIAAALEEAGSDDPTALRDAISGISLEDHLMAYDGPIEFDDTGENVNAQPIVMQVQDDDVVQVAPDTFAEAEAVFPSVPWQD